MILNVSVCSNENMLRCDWSSCVCFFSAAVVRSGTTLDLLKFPIINPTPNRMFRRQERLNEAERQAMGQLHGYINRACMCGSAR